MDRRLHTVSTDTAQNRPRPSDVALMMDQRRRRWSSIKTTYGERLVFAEKQLWIWNVILKIRQLFATYYIHI